MDASLTTPAMPLPLDLACGEGRNAVRLAEQGWTVTGVGSSDVGLDDARRMATDRGAVVEWICADATAWQPPDDGYGPVVVFYL
jgi:ubiquinone/menaquinone biosynthesis C-methylase UbiE